MARCISKTVEGKNCKKDAVTGSTKCSVHRAKRKSARKSRRPKRKSTRKSRRVSRAKMDKGRAFGALKKLWRGLRGAVDGGKKTEVNKIKKAIEDVSKKGGLKAPRYPSWAK